MEKEDMKWEYLESESDNAQIKNVFKNELFEPSIDIIYSILAKKDINRESLQKVYGRNFDAVLFAIGDYFMEHPDARGNELRKIEKSPKNIADAIRTYQSDSDMKRYFDDIERELHKGRMPTDLSLKMVYEENSNIAKNVIQVYHMHKDVRESGIYLISHPFYLSAIAHFMNLGIRGKILGLAHDLKEDNLIITKDDADEFYTLFNHKKFDEKYLIDEDIISMTDKLTNYISIILKHAETSIHNNGRRFNSSTLLTAINSLRANPYLEEMKDYMDKIAEVIEKKELDEDLVKHVKWLTYDTPYMSRLSKLCLSENGHKPQSLPYKLKGLDVVYNGIERIIPNINFNVRNINKQIVYVNNGYSLGLEDKSVNDIIEEVGQHALRSAYALMLNLMYNTQLDSAHMRVILKNMMQLSPVFYRNVKTDTVIL